MSSLNWHQLFQEYDIVLPQETRSVLEDPLHGFLDSSHLCYSYCDPQKHGVAGHGLAIYLKRSISAKYKVRLRSISEYVMWLELMAANSRYMIGNVYVPHSGMEEVYESLERDINCYHAEGAQVFCCGDFNAHTGQLEDRQLGFDGQAVLPICKRAGDAHAPNQSGIRLTDLCLSTGTVICTGRGSRGSSVALVRPSFTC